MSGHAHLRKLTGRNTQTARGDLQRARLSDVFVQPDGRFVIRGSNSREHIIEPNGEVVTTINRRTKSAHEQKIRNGERRQAMQIEFDYIKRFQ